MSTTIRTCQACDRKLLSRNDQRFCDDTCRNRYNRQKRHLAKITPRPNEKEIIKILKRNYELLKTQLPGQWETDNDIACDTEAFIASGVNINFYTNTFNSEGLKWFCIFDMCYTMEEAETPTVIQVSNRRKSENICLDSTKQCAQ